MTRIGLISDTHIPDHVKELPAQLKDVFGNVDLILHAGDVFVPSVLDELERLAPVLASEGDDDAWTPHNSGIWTLHDQRVKDRHVLNIDGVTIWLVHETCFFWPPRSRYERTPEVIVFGHTHRASLERNGDMLLVNPGSPTFPGYKQELGTVALLTINAGKADASIVQLH